MKPGKVDLKIYKGSTFEKKFYLLDATTREAIPLTDYTARMQIRGSKDSTTAILDLTTENSGIVITPATGEIKVKVTALVTEAISVNRGVYDLEIINPISEVHKVSYGYVTFIDEVTR